MQNKGLIVTLIIVAFVALVGFGTYYHYSNSEIRLRNLGEAQQQKNTAVFDTVWKILQSQAGVASEYKDQFKSVYQEIMSERYAGERERGAALMRFVQESNPTFDASLLRTLMASIEAQRTTFLKNQEQLINIRNQHKDLVQTVPGSWFVGGRSLLEITIVTSAKTDAVFSTGKEDDVDLFKK